jgi:signal transduction histidine kinase
MNLKGTGLGLCVCKQIIEQMGGKVSVKSKVGCGTKFFINLEILAIDFKNN